MSKDFLIDAIDCFISGDWGTDSYSIDTPIKVKCIRGADINNINSNDVASIPTRYISERSLSNKTLSAGDIVVEKSGGSPTQSTGRVAYISEHVVTSSDTVCSNFCTAFRVKDKWDSKYIYYYLRYIYDLGVFFNFEGKTSGIKNLDLERAYNSIPIKYIPKEKQQKVVKILTLLDKKIELNNKIISELEQMAKELYDYWFVQFDFPDVNGTPYRSSGGKLTYNPILKREIPNDWEVKYLESIAEIVGGSTPSTENQEYFTNSGICWITPKDLSNTNGAKYIFKGEKDLTELGIRSASLNVMPIGTVLMSSRAPVGYLSISAIETTTNQGLKSFIPNKGWSTVYLYHTIKHIMPIIEARATGSTFKEIAASDLRGIYWYIPPKELTNIFSEEISSSEIKIRNSLIQNEELSQLRDWLLPMLMNGQVSVQTVSKEETKKTTPIINLSQQQNQRFELWLSNQGAAARGKIDKATLREIFDAMDEDDK